MTFIKVLLIFLGTISLCVGVIGIFIPGLPTTPFLLLTAGLYLKSSARLHRALVTNKYVGSYILEFQSNKGMTKRVKLYSICTMWVMITISCVFLITPLSVKLFVSALGIVGTIFMGFIIPTVNNSNL
jgi:uncharacterized protein